MFRLLVLVFLAVDVAAASALLRYPDIRADRIVFSWAGDLWTVGVDGGRAQRVTSHQGYEYLPKFSPDGKTIAFSAEYEGSMDVYAMPAEGGEPRRLTFHPGADRVNGWTRDGRIVFRSKRTSIVPNYDKLFTIAPNGGMPAELPLPSAGTSSFSPDGTKIAYNRVAGESRFWKRYRGGTQSWISIFDLRTHAYEEIPHTDAGDLYPMWFGDAIYFISDRDGVMNLHRYDAGSKEIRQLTRHAEYDIKWPSLASDGSPLIVYENGGTLYRFDLRTETAAAIPIQVATDTAAVRPRTVNARKWINAIGLSPSGARALIGARGEVFTVPLKEGETRDITNTSGARELWPAWSPDGKWIAYASDRSGEYELYVRAQDGSGEERRLTSLGPGFRSGLVWSPDSTKLLFADITLSLYVVDVAGGAPSLIDRSGHEAIRRYDWSPDGRWVVYAKPIANGFGQLFVYSLETKARTAITTGMTDDLSPSFDPNGPYVYFLSRRTFNPTFSDFEKTFNFNDTLGVFVLSLRGDLPSPLAPRSDEEGASKPAAPQFRIDPEGITERAEALPIEAGDYRLLRARGGKLFWLAKKTLKSYDLAARSQKTIIDGIDTYDLDRAGSKVIYRAGEKIGVIDAGAESKVGDGLVPLDNLTMRLDPRAEWKQIFGEAWRMQRDNFYDPLMRGVDWPAMKARYERELPYVALRSDLSFLIGEMNGELGVSHITAYGGDTPEGAQVNIGLLGADFEAANGKIRLKKIYRGPGAPLAAPGLNVRDGDVLAAVNGRPLAADSDVYAAFEGLAGHQVRLRINDREIVVVPVASETQLRYRDWVEMNRRKVLAATNDRCAYIHLPDTGDQGISEFGRAFYAQSDKDCLLLDARWNNGGHIPDFFFERLARRHLEYDTPRYGADLEYQRPAILGPKVLVINEYAGSGGDSIADYFRKYALGTIVGKRTWGGLMGIGEELPMIDNGVVTVPHIAAWDVVDGKSVWIVENRGVEPDVEVDDRPDLVLAGRDPQLERALAILNAELAKFPVSKPARPAYGKP